MNKAIKLSDVCQPFTRQAAYVIDVPFDCIESTLSHWDDGKHGTALDLDPDFQRVHVWTREQQERYVEYVLREGHAGREIYFNCSSWMRGFDTPIVLVDGKQRLQAVRLFLGDKVQAFNHYFSEFENRAFINGPGLKFYVNNLKTRKEVLTWYLDLNTGGTPHTSEEVEKVRRMLAAEQR